MQMCAGAARGKAQMVRQVMDNDKSLWNKEVRAAANNVYHCEELHANCPATEELKRVIAAEGFRLPVICGKCFTQGHTKKQCPN